MMGLIVFFCFDLMFMVRKQTSTERECGVKNFIRRKREKNWNLQFLVVLIKVKWRIKSELSRIGSSETFKFIIYNNHQYLSPLQSTATRHRWAEMTPLWPFHGNRSNRLRRIKFLISTLTRGSSLREIQNQNEWSFGTIFTSSTTVTSCEVILNRFKAEF